MPLPVFLLALLVFACWSPATAADDRCREALLSASTTIGRAAIDARLQCELQRMAGKRTGIGCAETTLREIARVTAKATRRINRSCGGDDRRCGTSDDPSLAASGWPHFVCPGIPGSLACATPTSTCGDVAACLTCTAAASSDALGNLYDVARATDAAGRRCVRALGRGLASLLDTTATVDDACFASRLDGAPNGCRTHDRRIAAARSRHETAACRGCGGRDRRCDGVGDVTPDAIGWPGTCPPGIDGRCAGPVSAPEELAACLECLATPELECAQLLAVPSLEPYPATCRASMPTTTSSTSTTSTTSTTSIPPTTTSTTLPGAQCCPAYRMVIETVPGDGSEESPDTLYGFSFLNVRIANPIRLTVDVGPPDGDCRHAVVVPPGGLTLDPFCVPSLNLTADLLPRTCSVGDGIGRGTLWDGHSTTSDADIDVTVDTSDGVCNPPGEACTTVEYGAATNTLGGETVVRGNGVPDGPGLHVALELPVVSQGWLTTSAVCPDGDGVGNGNDQFAANDYITLRLSTATASAHFADTNGDGCAAAGFEPRQATVTGTPAAGPCCQVGQQLRLVGAGAQLQGSTPFNDALAVFDLPAVVVACEPPPAVAATCERLYGGGQVVTSFGEFDDLQGLASSDGGAFLALGTAFRRNFDPARPQDRFLESVGVARYLENGALDRTFGQDGRTRHTLDGTSTHVDGMTIDAGGRPVVTGWAVAGDQDFDVFVARLHPDGTLDTTFGDAGWTITDLGEIEAGRAVAARPTGGVVVAGETARPPSSAFVAAYDDGGDLDGDFGDAGVVRLDPSSSYDRVNAVVVGADGAVLVGGLTNSLDDGLDDDGDTYLARLTATGDPDESFGPDGTRVIPVGQYSDAVTALALTDEGDILALGRTQVADHGGQRPFLMRLSSDGTPVPGFGTDGIVLLGDPGGGSYLEAMRILPDGRILVSGRVLDASIGRYLMLVGRLGADGVPDPSFGSGGWVRLDFGGRDDLAAALMPLASGGLLVGGSYDPDGHFTTRKDFALARLLDDGARDLAFGTDQCQWQSPPDLRP